MKNIILNSVLLFCFTISFAQKDANIYIIFNNKPEVKSKNDSTSVELYKIDFNKKNRNQYDFDIDDSGNLIKNIKLKGSVEKSITLSYFNFNNNNNPILVSKNNFKNVLTLEEIINCTAPDHFLEIIRHFKNVYVININDIFEGYYIAKKVIIKENEKL